MPDENTALTPAARYILQGRIVTMGPAGVLPDGAVYVDQGRIHDVLPSGQPPPAFADAPLIRTEGSIYPGLIELHNHLCYNAMPLWQPPRKYANNGEWRTYDGDYARLISKPSQVLGRTQGVTEALVRYVECRCLLGGVTTSQGITLYSQGDIGAVFKGLIRNVERPEEPLPAADAHIANPVEGGARDFLTGLGHSTCYLQHLSEGTDEQARGWFLNLQLRNGEWAITKAFCGIHSTALLAEHFKVLAAHEGSMVWSPLSNYLLYGETADIRAARDAGVTIGIGSDWAPTGSKNLLGELKVAWLASHAKGHVFSSQEILAMAKGDVFSPQEILAMATVNAARILKWEDCLGTIEGGKMADLMVIGGQADDDYLRVIQARESDVALVTIGGVPRVGTVELMRGFGLAPAAVEEIHVGGAPRWLYLAQADAHPLVRNLTLGEATRRLRDAMQNLPELARRLDEQDANGIFAGSADETGAAWRVRMDFDDDSAELAMAARPLADFVTQPMTLEGITVEDDPGFLARLKAVIHLPAFIADGLPTLYGQPVPDTGSVHFVLEDSKPAPAAVVAARPLTDIMSLQGQLTMEERKTIVDQALLLLEQNYVHLPLKRAMHAVDPVQRLRLLRHRLNEVDSTALPPELEFHQEIARTFNSLRDLHTTYLLPYPYRDLMAWLPFLIEEFWEDNRWKYTVSRVVGKPRPATFEPGVEVLYWNGMPIERAVALNAERQAGSNPAAAHARGLNSLTIRPLSAGLPPDEEWVTLRYRAKDGRIDDLSQPWLVSPLDRNPFNVDPEAVGNEAIASALGLDTYGDQVQAAKRDLYAPRMVEYERQSLEVDQRGVVQLKRDAISNVPDGLSTYFPTVFIAKPVQTSKGTFGHIRIFTFNVSDADAFVAEFVRLIEGLPQDGLIIDVRGNSGGLIYAAERLLQVLTPRTIEPEKAQFISSAATLQLCQRNAPSKVFADLNLEPWRESLELAVETGATYSLAFPITDPQSCRDRGQAYYGPVVLITDALCYSATDIFAAGFQDHHIGKILGTSTNTGAGGANVWSHALIRRLLPPVNADDRPAADYHPLPSGADFRVAVRGTVRVGVNAGALVEDLGIVPDEIHKFTRRDLLEDNSDLLDKAGELLAGSPRYSFQVELQPCPSGLPVARLTTARISRVDVLFNERPWRSLNVDRSPLEIELAAIVAEAGGAERVLELRGYDGEELVAAFRRDLRLIETPGGG